MSEVFLTGVGFPQISVSVFHKIDVSVPSLYYSVVGVTVLGQSFFRISNRFSYSTVWNYRLV